MVKVEIKEGTDLKPEKGSSEKSSDGEYSFNETEGSAQEENDNSGKEIGDFVYKKFLLDAESEKRRIGITLSI